MKFSILNVSDTCARQQNLDKSGPILIDLLNKSTKLVAEIVTYTIVADEISEIECFLKRYAPESDIILTIGGTGLSKRDITPEATKNVIERECNGISTALLVRGLQSTKNAALSRHVISEIFKVEL